ncbi:MAG: hypothetical protein ACPKM0_07500 [Pleomorphochaeta sp.]
MRKYFLIFTTFIILFMSGCASAKPIIIPKSPTVIKPKTVTTKKKYQIITKDIVFDNDCLNVSGTLKVPEGDEYYPLVIIDYSGEEKDQFSKAIDSFALELLDNNIATFIIDYSLSDEITATEINALTDYLADLDEINGSRIGLLGWDIGATNILLAAKNSNKYESIATWAANLKESDKNSTKILISYENSFFTHKKNRYNKFIPIKKKIVYKTTINNDFDFVSDINIPIASFYGDEDKTASISYSKQIQELNTNKKSKLVLIENANHTFQFSTDDSIIFEDLEKQTVDWFVETLT